MRQTLLLFIVGISWSFLSLKATEREAKTILEQALEKQNNITFTATIISGEGDFRVEQRVFQRKNPDGTVSKRLETRSKAAGENVYLRSDSGTYDIYPEAKKMVKINFDRADEVLDYSKYTSYKIRRGKILGQDCYIITARIADNPAVFSAFEKAVRASNPVPMTRAQCRQLFLRVFPATSVYYIGVNNLFIYSREYFTFDGKSKGRVTYSDVKFSPSIKDSTFVLPSGYSIEYADNSKEFLQATNRIGTAISDKKLKEKFSVKRPLGPSFIERFFNWIDYNFSTIISVTSKVLFWTAMVIIVVVVVIKLKSRSN